MSNFWTFFLLGLLCLFQNSDPLLAQTGDVGKGNHLFEVEAPSDVKEVTVAGEFNAWDMKSIRLVKINGKWQKRVNLSKGKYAYKFVADGDWDKLNKSNLVMEITADPLADVPVVGASTKQRLVVLSYNPAIKVQSVFLVGSFNGWNNTANPMKDVNGRWETSLLLDDGEYAYKFLVNGNQWIPDPNNTKTIDDGFGGKNSVLEVGSQFASLDVKSGDGNIATSGILFSPDSYNYLNPMGKDLMVRLRLFKGDVEKVSLIYKGKEFPLSVYAEGPSFATYSVFMGNVPAKIGFYFKLKDGKTVEYFTPKGLVKNPGASYFMYDKKKMKPFTTPEWVKGAVFYQIFPERFLNGDPSNDLKGFYPITPRPEGKAWSVNDSYLEDWDTGKPAYGNTFGGDLKGIIAKLEYLKSLGITAIYLNPVFKSPSNHKYDIIDYMSIDPQFGDLPLFKELITRAHALGMKVILDGVFNHTADESVYFQDVAKNGPKSPYYGWYQIKKWPFPGGYPPKFGPGADEPKNYYECWWGFGDMPKLNYKSRDVRDFINKVGAYWVSEMGADGWRLDVPNEVPHDFWKEFRIAVKKANPDAYIVGEIWGNGEEWLRGDEFDAVMNYRFRDLMIDFFAKGTLPPSKMAETLSQFKIDYPPQVNLVQFNLLDSHDTVRFINVCNSNMDMLKLASAFQLLYPGAASVYYGTEIGLKGDKDPDNRRPFIWDESSWNLQLLEHYKKFITLRKTYPQFQKGEMDVVYSDDTTGIIGFKYTLGKQPAFAFFNRTPNDQTVSFNPSKNRKEGIVIDLMTQTETRLPTEGLNLRVPAYSVSLVLLK